MLIRGLKTKNFRNLQSLDLSFNQGFVVFSGRNGSGKTNVLESLYFGLSLGRFPESKLAYLFRNGENFFQVGIKNIDGAGEEQIKKLAYETHATGGYHYKLYLDSREVRRREYVKNNPVISFLPQDLNLLTGSPSRRRRYLDEVLRQASAEYQSSLSNYTKVLMQRNQLWQKILTQNSGESELDVWDSQLALYGAKIVAERKRFIQNLNQSFFESLAELSPGLEKVEVIYMASLEQDEGEFLKALRSRRSEERRYGTTVVGPHRDDFRIQSVRGNVLGQISRGQTRGIVLTLKILEKAFLEKELGLIPGFLLDDVFSEFDTQHQENIIQTLDAMKQVFITTSHPEEISAFLPKSKITHFEVMQGEVFPKEDNV